jgi:iron complex outermembrane receptor protein
MGAQSSLRSHVRATEASHMILALIAGASALSAASAQAQTAAAPAAEQAAKSSKIEDSTVDQIIVTGVMAGTQAKKANVSFSVMSEDDMSKFTPISADDMLRDMPGVVVESNDGVARNEVFTRGMTIGTGANTSGYFWTTILEDGLPVVPFKFSGFQDGYFYRADISTSRVESVRGGSSATGVTTSVGATFNYITGAVKPGGVIQTRLGFEGEDLHLSWKQVDGSYGWVNKAGDAGIGRQRLLSPLQRPGEPGLEPEPRRPVQGERYKEYTGAGGSGSFNVILKHLDDTNAELTTFQQPTYGYQNAQEIPGFGRDVNLFMNGGQQTVPNYFKPGSHALDPSDGYRYKQDAISLSWRHDTDGPWSFTGALRAQKSTYRGQSYKPQGLASLGSAAATRERFGLNINNLDRTPGYYEFYNAAGAAGRQRRQQRQRLAAGNELPHRRGLPAGDRRPTSRPTASASWPTACPTATSTCVAAWSPPPSPARAAASIPVSCRRDRASQDLVLLTRAEDNDRESKDFMGNFTTSYHGDNYGLNSASTSRDPSRPTTTGPTAWACQPGPMVRSRT